MLKLLKKLIDLLLGRVKAEVVAVDSKIASVEADAKKIEATEAKVAAVVEEAKKEI